MPREDICPTGATAALAESALKHVRRHLLPGHGLNPPRQASELDAPSRNATHAEVAIQRDALPRKDKRSHRIALRSTEQPHPPFDRRDLQPDVFDLQSSGGVLADGRNRSVKSAHRGSDTVTPHESVAHG